MIRSVLRRLRSLKDVAATDIADGDTLVWDATTGKFTTGDSTAATSFDSVWEGTNGFAYGHSYLTTVGSGPLANVSSIYTSRLAKRLGMAAFTSRAVAGSEAIDVLATATAGASVFNNGTAGMIVVDNITNDLFQDGGTTDGLLQYKNATRDLIWLLLAYTKSTDSGINGVYTVTNGRVEMASTAIFSAGGATETATNEFSNGSAVYSDSNGAVATFTVNGTDILLFLCGRKDGVSGINGGTARITVDGVTHGADVPLGNVYRQSTLSGTKYRGPHCVPLLGLSAGSHTITVTNVGSNGTRLGVDFWSRLVTRTPDIFICQQPYFKSTQYNQASSPSGIDAFNAALAAVVAEFSAYNVYLVPVQTDWEPNTMMSATQSRHPNDIGANHYVNKLLEVIEPITTYRSGRHNL